MAMKVYCVHPISGLSYNEVLIYYKEINEYLKGLGYDVLCPMTGKEELITEKKFKTVGYENSPVSSSHAIFERDKWMVLQADIIFANFVNAKEISIGSCMELAWASLLNKQTVVIMGKDNKHQHAFVIEASDIIFDNLEKGKDYMKKLIQGI